MRSRANQRVAAAFLTWLVVTAVAAAGPANPSTDQPPQPTTLKESLEKRLVQLDVGVEGDPDVIRSITAKDFVLYVGEHEVQGLIVDHLCGAAQPPPGEATQEDVGTLPAPRSRGTFILFFDQPHLTTLGRELSLEISRELITRLIVNGARASIVSNAKRLETIVPLTEDREKLLAGLERLRADSRQWDSYSATERARHDEVLEAYRFDPNQRCPSLMAETYAREEFLVARRSTQRLGFALNSLADAPAPKALVYFGDSLRQKAGLHYLHIYCPDSLDAQSAEMVPSAAAEFDAVINEALARGVHFFTIQAEGLLAYGLGWDTERHHQAQDALVGLAAETGGEAFLGGASNDYITGRIAARTSCSLLLSFPPGDLARDTPLPLTIELHVPKVKLRAQGRVVVASPASIENARLTAAFADPTSSDDGSLRALLVPRGGDGKNWRVAVQLRLQPSGIPDTSAELGASIVRRDRVSNQFASSIATKSGTRALVVEKSLDLSPGEFSVVAVARDVGRGEVASSRLDAVWPNPAKGAATIAPIAVLQNGVAAISQDGKVHSSGSLARDVDELLDPSAVVVLESVVCRGATTKGPVVVERSLDQGVPGEFAPMKIAGTGAPCVQIVDALRAGRLQPGVFEYRVVASTGDAIAAQERRALRVGTAGGQK